MLFQERVNTSWAERITHGNPRPLAILGLYPLLTYTQRVPSLYETRLGSPASGNFGHHSLGHCSTPSISASGNHCCNSSAYVQRYGDGSGSNCRNQHPETLVEFVCLEGDYVPLHHGGHKPVEWVGNHDHQHRGAAVKGSVLQWGDVLAAHANAG